MISPTSLQEFKIIMQKDYDFTLDDTEATRLAEDYLIALEAVITSPREDLTTHDSKGHNDT